MVPLDGNGGLGRRPENRDTAGWLEYFSTGALSLLASALCLAVGYHTVVSLTQQLHVLSTTAIVVGFLALWTTVWLVFELIWDRRTGRRSST